MILGKSKGKPKKDFVPRGDFAPRKDFAPRRDFPPREMVKGNWKCSDCGTEITELPFEPAPDRPIYCRECWQKRRAQRPRTFER